MPSRPETIQIKAESAGGVLYGWTLEGVIETSPVRVAVKLAREAGRIALGETTATKALTALAEEPEKAEALYLFAGDDYRSERPRW